MIDGAALITEILRILKEPTDGTGQYTRAVVLQALNLVQDEISSDIPDLLRTKDTSLVTVASNGSYTIPATIGKIYEIWVNGIAMNLSTEDTQSRDNLRGRQEDNWFNTSGVPVTAYVRNNLLFLDPYANTAGQTITIVGELLLTQITDSTASFPFENLPFLRKAQRALIYLAAVYLAIEDNNQSLVNNLEAKAQAIIDKIKIEWMVLRPSDEGSTLTMQMSEDSAG